MGGPRGQKSVRATALTARTVQAPMVVVVIRRIQSVTISKACSASASLARPHYGYIERKVVYSMLYIRYSHQQTRDRKLFSCDPAYSWRVTGRHVRIYTYESHNIATDHWLSLADMDTACGRYICCGWYGLQLKLKWSSRLKPWMLLSLVWSFSADGFAISQKCFEIRVIERRQLCQTETYNQNVCCNSMDGMSFGNKINEVTPRAGFRPQDARAIQVRWAPRTQALK